MLYFDTVAVLSYVGPPVYHALAHQYIICWPTSIACVGPLVHGISCVGMFVVESSRRRNGISICSSKGRWFC